MQKTSPLGTIIDRVVGSINGQGYASDIHSSLFSPNKGKAVLTDTNGEFIVVHGVGRIMGISVTPTFSKYPEILSTLEDIEWEDGIILFNPVLRRGPDINGTVHDVNGRPLAEVRINDGSQTKAVTDESGKIYIAKPQKWHDGGQAFYLSFEKDRYQDFNLYPKNTKPLTAISCMNDQPSVEPSMGCLTMPYRQQLASGSILDLTRVDIRRSKSFHLFPIGKSRDPRAEHGLDRHPIARLCPSGNQSKSLWHEEHHLTVQMVKDTELMDRYRLGSLERAADSFNARTTINQ